jgi:hypothetical protein
MVEITLVEMTPDVRQVAKAELRRLRRESLKPLIALPLFFLFLLPLAWLQNPQLRQTEVVYVSLIVVGILVLIAMALIYRAERKATRRPMEQLKEDLAKAKVEVISCNASDFEDEPLIHLTDDSSEDVSAGSDTSKVLPQSQIMVVRLPVSGRIVSVHCDGKFLPPSHYLYFSTLPPSATARSGDLEKVEKAPRSKPSKKGLSIGTWGCAILGGGLAAMMVISFVAMATIHAYHAVRLYSGGKQTTASVFIAGIKIIDRGEECYYEFIVNQQRFTGRGPAELNRKGQTLTVLYDPLDPRRNRPANGLLTDILLGGFVWILLIAIASGLIHDEMRRRRRAASREAE